MADHKRLIEWAVRYRERLESLSDEAVSILSGGLTSAWDDLVDDVTRFYRAVQQDGSREYSLTDALNRLGKVSEAIASWLPDNSPELRSLTRKFARSLQQSENLGLEFGEKMKRLSNPESDIVKLTRVPFAATIEVATGIASRMWRYNTDLRIRAGQSVVNSLVRGQSPAGLARQLREFIGGPISGVERIARTEMASAFVKSQIKSYEAEDIELGQWAAVESIRTCPFCSARHMKVYRLAEVIVPAHPNCLCSILPVSKERLKSDRFIEASWRDRQAVIKKLEQAGVKLNNGQTPFERFSGVQPPKPVWEPINPDE